jgi:2-polyprenyl-3-methyl-5-hydroxy-6-metoxy-1,4-benzoquinol methylase
MHDDGPRWNERYAASPAPSPRAPEALDRWPELASALPGSGRCLDIASGTGAVSLWLAQRGLEVTALDFSDVAIGRLEAAATASGLSGRLDARTVDLDQGLPEDLADLDVVVCQRFRDPALYRPIVDRLRPGGLAVVTVLSSVGADDPGPFHAAAGELSTAFGADERCEILHQFEADGVAHVVVRRR